MFKIAVTSLLTLLLSLSSYAGGVKSTWDANAEADLAGYKIYYGTASGQYNVEIDIGNVASATIDNLQAGTTYYFAVTAYDKTGNESGFSVEVSLAMPDAPDTESPQPPKNVSVVISTSP